VCQTHQSPTEASLDDQCPTSGWIALHFWHGCSSPLRCSPLSFRSCRQAGRLWRRNSLQLLTQTRAHKDACGLWLTDGRSVPCQPEMGIGAEREAAPDSSFTGHSVPAARAAESNHLWKCKLKNIHLSEKVSKRV